MFVVVVVVVVVVDGYMEFGHDVDILTLIE
jgi:hypothetical protein